MSQHRGKASYGRLSGENYELDESKSKISVDSTALISDRGVVPVHGVLESQRQQLINAWLWVLGTASFSAYTTYFTYTVFISEKPVPHYYDFSPERTISLVNIASHISVFITSGLVGAVLDTLHWALASRPRGVSMITFLTTKQDTSALSAANLFLTRGAHQKWCILRYSRLICLSP
jgi:hypothetical protein